MISTETKEMLHSSMKVPLLEISKARMYVLNVLSDIEECEVELRTIDLAIDMDDREAAKAIEVWLKNTDIVNRFTECVGLLSYVRIPEKFKEYSLNLKENYSIGKKTLMEY